jgi:hypothetical protein
VGAAAVGYLRMRFPVWSFRRLNTRGVTEIIGRRKAARSWFNTLDEESSDIITQQDLLIDNRLISVSRSIGMFVVS